MTGKLHPIRCASSSAEARIAEVIIEPARCGLQATAAGFDLLDLHEPGWRRRWARAEMIGAFQAARAAGLGWPEVCLMAQSAAVELRTAELHREHGR